MRRAGIAAVTGAIMAIAGNAVIVVIGTTDPSIPNEQVSYPLSTGAFAVGQFWFAVSQGLMAIGVLGLVRSTLVSASRLRTVLGTLAVLGMSMTVPGELVLITVAAEDSDSSAVSAASTVFGIGVLLANVALIGFGTLALRQRRWSLPWRALPLAYALFHLLIATPVSLAFGFASLASFIVIATADVLMALIGLALLRAAADGGQKGQNRTPAFQGGRATA